METGRKLGEKSSRYKSEREQTQTERREKLTEIRKKKDTTTVQRRRKQRSKTLIGRRNFARVRFRRWKRKRIAKRRCWTQNKKGKERCGERERERENIAKRKKG